MLVAYVRVSTREQHLGPEAQRAAIESWAEAQGASIAAWFEDFGVSGRRRWDRRPGLVAALDAARKKKATLVVMKLDRLGRGQETMVAIEAELRRRKIPFRSVAGEGTEGNESHHQFQRGILHAVSGFELARIGERTRAVLAVKRAKGEVYSRVAPFGWQHIEGRLEPEPSEQETIAFVLDQREKGRSIRAIEKDAAARGMQGRSGPLYLSQIASILRRNRNLSAAVREGMKKPTDERQRRD